MRELLVRCERPDQRPPTAKIHPRATAAGVHLLVTESKAKLRSSLGGPTIPTYSWEKLTNDGAGNLHYLLLIN